MHHCTTIRIVSIQTFQRLVATIVTAIFAGGISAIQVSAHVVRFQAYDAVGWGFGFVVFRELLQ